MKAGHLAHKSHLRKHKELPQAGGRHYDLTRDAAEDDAMDIACDDRTVFDLTRAPVAGTTRDIASLPALFTTDEDIFTWCQAVLNHSPAARVLLHDATAHGWRFGTADLHGGGYYMDADNREILLDHFSMNPAALGRSLYFRNAFLTAFIRALRDIAHEENNTVAGPHYTPEHILMRERVRAADCDTLVILSVWELRCAGFADIWRHLLGSEEGDMAMIFTRYLERDPSAFFDGSALAYAFRQWYADQARVDTVDHATLEMLDDVLMQSDALNPFGHREMQDNDIEALSALPDGTRYLAGLGRTIMADPFFAGMNDPINQTHLFHLMYDTEVTMVNNVPFRDGRLARKIFPKAEIVKNWR